MNIFWNSNLAAFSRRQAFGFIGAITLHAVYASPIPVVFARYDDEELPFNYVAANWTGRQFVAEYWMKATTGTVFAEVFDITDGVQVGGSQKQEDLAAYTRSETGALTFIDGHLYTIRFGKDTGDAGFGKGKLISTSQ